MPNSMHLAFAAAVFRFWGLILAFVMSPTAAAQGTSPAPALVQGPMLLQLEAQSCELWFRFNDESTRQLELLALDPISKHSRRFDLKPLKSRDYCVTIALPDLQPKKRYRIRVLDQKGKFVAESAIYLTTPPLKRRTNRLIFGSCVDEDEACGRVLECIGSDRPDAMVLLGDSPYIDSTRLSVQRQRYREFADWGPFASLVRRVPLYSIWDDHDFGKNDSDGNLKGKHNSRQAFFEYRSSPEREALGEGLYRSFSLGNADIFLLDTRTFAATEDSPAAPGHPTLLGVDQWQWLTNALKNSRATFKILACGMIWNGAVRPGKTDHWAHYRAEREALFEFIGDQKLSGVILVGGDIHRSRHLSHHSQNSAGYRLHEFITSPMHKRIIKTANQPHPGLLWDRGAPHSYLLMDVHAQTLNFKFLNSDREVLHEGNLAAADLVFRPPLDAANQTALAELRKLMQSTGTPADFSQVETHIHNHPRLSGSVFANSALVCASWLMAKSEFQRARRLYQRLLGEPRYQGAGGVRSVLDAQIERCDLELAKKKAAK